MNTARDTPWRIDNYLRMCIGYKFEAEICQELSRYFEGDFQRGQEGSTFDGGILLRNTDGSHKPTSTFNIEIKTGVIALREVKVHDDQRQKSWRSDIVHRPRQEDCDLLILAHPLLRDHDFWTLLPRQTEWFERKNRLFEWAGFSTFMEPVVHPSFWPLTFSKHEALPIISGLRAGRVAHNQILSTVESGKSSASDEIADHEAFDDAVNGLMNEQARDYHAFFAYLVAQTQMESNGQIRVRHPLYQPLTADIHLELAAGYEFFVEVKFGLCEVVEASKAQVKIKHIKQHPNSGLPYFSAESGRWTWLLTEVSSSSRRFIFQGYSVPLQMAFIPRSKIPSDWWSEQSDQSLDAWIPGSWIIDMRTNPSTQILKILGCSQVEDLRLPALDSVPAPYTVKNATTGVDDSNGVELRGLEAEIEMLKFSRSVEGKSCHTHREYQSAAAYNLFRECRTSSQGVLYDLDMTSFQLRRYPFTSYRWTSEDERFVSRRPRCIPVQMFELSRQIPYIHLSFGLMRQESSTNSILVHPFVGKRLRHDASNNHPLHRQRLLILSSEGNAASGLNTNPLYALPTAMIRHPNLEREFVNRSQWRALLIPKQFKLSHFHFDSIGHVCKELLRSIEQAQMKGQQSLRFRDVDIELTTAERVFEELQPRYAEWLQLGI